MTADPTQTSLADISDEPGFVPDRLDLFETFGLPPFTGLDAQKGRWQDRKRAWQALGIKSELGRGDSLLGMGSLVGGASSLGDLTDEQRREYARRRAAGEGHKRALEYMGIYADFGSLSQTSIFDPVLAELMYRWYSPADGAVLDPFAGGSVRGLVASVLRRNYHGIDLRAEQVAANEEQAHIGRDTHPAMWTHGDSREILATLAPESYDFVLTCPPYYNLERYSDDPRDLSNARTYADFDAWHSEIIALAARALKPDRYMVWVTGDVRDKDGALVALTVDTTNAARRAGLRLWNDHIYNAAIGTAAVRARSFPANRKAMRTTQAVNVYAKGDGGRAADACGRCEVEDGDLW